MDVLLFIRNNKYINEEIKRLLSKGMSNIYLKVTIEKSDLLKTSNLKV